MRRRRVAALVRCDDHAGSGPQGVTGGQGFRIRDVEGGAQAAGLERMEEADGVHILALCVPDDAAADAIAITADDLDRMRETDLQATTAALRDQLSAEIDGIEGEEQLLESDIDAAESSTPHLAQDSERNNRLRQLAKRFQKGAGLVAAHQARPER